NLKNICVYQAFRNEVSCDKITEYAFEAGKYVFVPVTDQESRTMEFYPVTRDTRWVEGAYGILEPVLEEHTPVLTGKALILMPGLAFDKDRHRIGYGGGYYDKYLAGHTGHVTAALCYHFQVVEGILPYEDHDWTPNYIITDKEQF
ncbi:MAG: 5-formyltetrahydrofolate cyclo-ligase, partial [Lachnospiraceae bacterium]|nr:5-formyltetrahydrofolate cyclo-ligase [Lachnospiraceae bacterium]